MYVRRDMKRFMPFLVRFDDGTEGWFAAVFIEVTPLQTTERTINGRPFSELPQEERDHIEFGERMGW